MTPPHFSTKWSFRKELGRYPEVLITSSGMTNLKLDFLFCNRGDFAHGQRRDYFSPGGWMIGSFATGMKRYA